MILIRGARIIDPVSGLDAVGDLLAAGGVVAAIRERITPEEAPVLAAGAAAGTAAGPTAGAASGTSADAAGVPEGLTVIDAAGLVCAPGLVDTHVHFRDPGFPEKEDIASGARAAAAGGFTTVLMMANTAPPIDCVPVLEDVLSRGRMTGIRVCSAANVTVGMQGRELTDMAALAAAGAAVFTDDGRPVTDEALLRRALRTARALGRPVSLHEEDPAYVAEPGINAGGPAAAHFGIRGADRMAEISMIARDVRIAAEEDAALCIQHISTVEGVDLVRAARRTDPRITAEATPQHFSLTEEAVIEKGALAKVNPPIRTERDRQAIIEGIMDGTIGMIATDHAPHTAAEKARTPITAAPSGLIGLETSLSLGLKYLVQPGHITLARLLELMGAAPAAYYRLPAGRLMEGGPADIVLFDEKGERTVTAHFASRSSNSPFIGMTLPGIVRCTIAAGKIVYSSL